jgi:WW domain-binding protein 2
MVFVEKDYLKKEFKSFDIPLALMFGEKFEQPIFGSNYLCGNYNLEIYNNIFNC